MQNSALSLHGKVLAVGASVRSCQKIPLCLTESTSAHSSTDPPPAKDEPVGSDARVSGVRDLRRQKPRQQQLQPQRGIKVCERNRSAATQVSAAETGDGACL